jgi:ligand-binding SRPBCC domain-containing protein
MATYERTTRVDAPFESVWKFHSTVDGLVRLTPGFLNIRIEALRGPDGEPDPEVLVEGSEVHASVRPFGVGPRQEWLSRIVERHREGDRAWFRDEMVDGPFRRWVHTHEFVGVDGASLASDSVEYDLPRPLGPLAPLARLGLAPAFHYRHRRTRELLE